MSVTLGCLIVLGAAFDAPFQQANTFYEQEDFASAARGYEQLVSEGVEHEALFFNLGNAYYRSGNLGAAIANYERALRQDPDHAAARHNLELAVQSTKHQWGRPLPRAWEQSLLMWHGAWRPREVYWSAVICWWALWAFLTLRLWKDNKWFTRLAVVSALAAAAFTTSAYSKYHPEDLAVAVRDGAAVRYGIGESQTLNFELMQGDRVVVDDRREGWMQIRTADGGRGWVEASALMLVGPPYSPAIAAPQQP